MDPLPWKPSPGWFNLDDQIEEAFARLIDEPWGRPLGLKSWQPDIDIYETDDAYLVEADLPGVAPENLEIQVENNRLTITGTRKSASYAQSGQRVWVERRQGRFSRSFPLSASVDPNQIEIRQEQGIYYIRLPKKKSSNIGNQPEQSS